MTGAATGYEAYARRRRIFRRIDPLMESSHALHGMVAPAVASAGSGGTLSLGSEPRRYLALGVDRHAEAASHRLFYRRCDRHGARPRRQHLDFVAKHDRRACARAADAAQRVLGAAGPALVRSD